MSSNQRVVKRWYVYLSVIVIAALLLPASVQAKKSRFYGGHLCHDPRYYCQKVQRGDSWQRMFPDAEDRQIVMRLNRTNISLRYRPWIVVPKNLRRVDLMDITPLPMRVRTNGQKLILIDLKKHAFAAYNAHGYQVHWGPVSGGKGWCPDVGRTCRTIIGKFKMVRKQGQGCISSKFPLPNGGAKMPYCMHFYKGYAMHGSTLPGYHASHGCVRLFTNDAKWLNHHFINVGGRGTPVVIVR